MIELIRITESDSPQARQLIALHAATFPQYERFRGTSLLARLIDNAPPMHFNAIHEGGVPTGFLIYWELGTAYYIHFIAVFEQMRNHGIGRQVLSWVAENLHRPVFLESEVPYDEITSRRFDFYKRNGFRTLAEDPEILASVRRGGHPQWLMGTQAVDNLDGYLEKVNRMVYHATGE